MTRAPDGTYWRVRSNDETIGEYDAIELAYPMASQLSAEYPNISIVRIRPRMSIVRAVRLLTEAQGKGAKLWMRSAKFGRTLWVKKENELFYFVRTDKPYIIDGTDIESRWIVATPEDARKIDARGKK